MSNKAREGEEIEQPPKTVSRSSKRKVLSKYWVGREHKEERERERERERESEGFTVRRAAVAFLPFSSFSNC